MKQVRFLINYLIILCICNVLCFQLSILWRLAGEFYKGQQLVKDCRIHYLHTFWAHTYSLYQKKTQKFNIYLLSFCFNTCISTRKNLHIRLCMGWAVWKVVYSSNSLRKLSFVTLLNKVARYLGLYSSVNTAISSNKR